jgi:hypothetical protein
MNIVFLIGVWTWAVLGTIVLVLALYRVVLTWGDYTVLHVRRSELQLIPEQALHSRRVAHVERWGQALTVAVAILGLLLVVAYLYVAVTQMQYT